MKKAVVTGASSGIGRDIAIELASKGYFVYIVARNIDKLNDIKNEIGENAQVIQMDISSVDNCKALAKQVGDDIDILVNNAGFGVFGRFTDTDLDREISLINTNVTAVHVLTKLFLEKMIKNNSGYILNVSSIAGHLSGPLMAAYYASKNYVSVLSNSINYELKKDNINVKVGTLNPGPVRTNFNNVANVHFDLASLSSDYVAKYTVMQMLKGKTDITPGFNIKCTRFLAKILPYTIMNKFVYKSQKRKES